jgi:KH domain
VLWELKTIDVQLTSLPAQPLPPLDDDYPTPPPLASTEPLWELYNIYQNEDVEKTDCTWLLKAKTEADLKKGFDILKSVFKDEMHNSWKGLLTFPTNPSFSRIVGRQGETVKHLQEKTNTRIDVPEAGKGTTFIIIGQ